MHARHKLGLVFALAVSAVALPAYASEAMGSLGGFDQSSISKFVQSQAASFGDASLARDEAKDLLGVLDYAAKFRAVATIDPLKPRDFFAGDNQQVLTDLLDSPVSREAPFIWSYFFRNSSMYVGHAKARISRIGYYNSLVDGWVMTDWRHDINETRLLALRVVPGEVVRGETVKGDEQIEWTKLTDRSIARAMQYTHRRTVAAFRKAHPFPTAKPLRLLSETPSIILHREMVEVRLINALSGVVFAEDNTTVRSSVHKLLEAIGSGKTEELQGFFGHPTKMPMHLIASLPRSLRIQFEPTAYFERQTGITVTLGVAESGRWVLAAEYEGNPRNGPIELNALVFFDLETIP